MGYFCDSIYEIRCFTGLLHSINFGMEFSVLSDVPKLINMSKKRFFFGFLPFFLVCFFSFLVSFGQKVKKADRVDFNQFSTALSLYYLSCNEDKIYADSIENFSSSTDSVVVNADEFSSVLFLDSLMTAGDKSFGRRYGLDWTSFSIRSSSPYAPNKENFFFIDEQEVVFEKDYFFLPSNQNFVGESFVSIAVKEEGVPWFFSWEEFIRSRGEWKTALNGFKDGNKLILWELFCDFSKSMKEKGASAIVFHAKDFPFQFSSFFSPLTEIQQLELPVVFMTEKSWNKFFPDFDGSHECKWRFQAKTVSFLHKFSVGKIENGQKPWKVVFVDQDDFSTAVFSVWLPLLISGEEKKGSYFNYLFVHGPFSVFFNSSLDSNFYVKSAQPWEVRKNALLFDKGFFKKDFSMTDLLWYTIKKTYSWKDVDFSSSIHLSLSKNYPIFEKGINLNSTDFFSNLSTVYPEKQQWERLMEEQKFKTSLFYQCKQTTDSLLK